VKKQGEHSVKACVLRGAFVLLPLALALCVTSFALERRRHREFSKRTLTFPSLLLDQQQPKNHQVETTADSVTNRHHAPVSKPAEPPAAPLDPRCSQRHNNTLTHAPNEQELGRKAGGRCSQLSVPHRSDWLRRPFCIVVISVRERCSELRSNLANR
jgi:hypothetical protein